MKKAKKQKDCSHCDLPLKSTEGEQYWRGWKAFCSEDALSEEAKMKWLKDLRKSIPIIIPVSYTHLTLPTILLV